MALRGFHLRVAQILGDATGSKGFALGGGYGLQTHELADRPSNDLDTYVDKFDPEIFDRAEQALIAELERDGLSAQVVTELDVLRAILVNGESEGESVVIDLGYDYRDHPPVVIRGIGPVLDVEDIITGKVRAFIDRGGSYAIARDYSDIDGILADSQARWSIADLFNKGRVVFPDVEVGWFAERLRRADRPDPAEYLGIGLGPTKVSEMKVRLSRFADELEKWAF